MTAVRSLARVLSVAALVGATLCGTAACGSGEPKNAAAPTRTTWQEPESYAYTLTSTTQVLAGTFRVEVRDGRVTEVIGVDEDSQRQVREVPGEVPTIGELLKRLAKARSDNAHTAQAEYAADGRPKRISLDWDEKTVDDEALYLISAYEPAGR
ncbi:DUF6174 domain-containing protein [Streptomyces shenzhenensis]|uniref:DUF6174 domain-containing protein n=1 Tax=Streptomyces shenzhenensis TaxID=943815 RepID=UPI0036B8B4C4